MSMRLTVLALVGLGAVTGCTAPAPQRVLADAPAPSSSVPAVVESCAPVEGHAPARIVVFQDKSGSANFTRTEALTEAHLRQLAGVLCRGGGTLALGLIADDSNHTLLRLMLPVPPASPVYEDVPSNPFQANKAKARNAAIAKAFESRVATWQVEAGRRIGVFLEGANALLARAANAPRTDVTQALVRAERFLREPIAVRQEGHAWAIFNTDGEDTAHRTAAPAALPAHVLVVNGAGHAGPLLPDYNPTTFEALSAAVEYLDASEAEVR